MKSSSFVTYAVKSSSSWTAYIRSAIKNARLLKSEILLVHKSPPLDSVLSQMSPLHFLTTCYIRSIVTSSRFVLPYLEVRLHFGVFDWYRMSNSSGSIVSGYGLDDRVIGVRSPTEARNFSSILCVQTGSGAHPVSCTVGTGGPFPGGKARPWRDADHSPPSSAEVVNE
jgi:hypothetical protein